MKTIKTNLELYRGVLGGNRWLHATGDSQEEAMIFRYRQTNRHFIKIYIKFSHWVFKRTSSRNENKTHPLSKPTSSYSAFLPQVHRICCSVPFYHCFGNVAGTLAGLLHGASLIVPCPRFCRFWWPVWSKILCGLNKPFSFNGGDCVTAIENEKCTSIYGERQINNMNFNLSQSRFHFRHTNNVCWYVGTGCKQRHNQALTK